MVTIDMSPMFAFKKIETVTFDESSMISGMTIDKTQVSSRIFQSGLISKI